MNVTALHQELAAVARGSSALLAALARAPGDHGYGVERIGAITFVIIVLVVVLAVGACICLGLCPPLLRNASRTCFWTAAGAQVLLLGLLAGVWAYFVPCFWLACDHGPDDDYQLRALLLAVVWFVTTLVLLTPCAIGGWQCGLVRTEAHTTLCGGRRVRRRRARRTAPLADGKRTDDSSEILDGEEEEGEEGDDDL
jgi:hypothetical protein